MFSLAHIHTVEKQAERKLIEQKLPQFLDTHQINVIPFNSSSYSPPLSKYELEEDLTCVQQQSLS